MSAPRVLIVDDEPPIRQLVAGALEHEGFELLEASDGDEALTLLAASPVDLVLLDWQMPGLSGPEVLSALKHRHPTTNVILLTAILDARHAGLAGIFGADAFLAKPFGVDELISTVRQVLA